MKQNRCYLPDSIYLIASFFVLTGCTGSVEMKDLNSSVPSAEIPQNLTDDPVSHSPPQALESSSGVVVLEGSKGFKMVASIGSPVLNPSQVGTKGFKMSTSVGRGSK